MRRATALLFSALLIGCTTAWSLPKRPAAAVRVGQTARLLNPVQPSVAEVLLGRATVARQTQARLLGDAITAEAARAEVERAALATKAEAERIEAGRVAAAEAQRLADEESDRLTAASKRETLRLVEVTTTTTRLTAVPGTAPAAAASSGTGACGGALPPCSVMRRESGGNPSAINPTGCYDNNPESAGYGTRGCFGKWQFMRATWWGLGFSGLPTDFGEGTQDAGAAKLWAGGAGCKHWDAC